jgi:cytochrome c oxidase subunit II
MRWLPSLTRGLPALTIAVVAVAGGCDGDSSQDHEVGLSPAAERGRQVARDSGCAACHGSNGDGATGPGWVGLYGSEVALSDGSTVVADDAYLAESIAEPRAKVVEGFGVPMPENNLDQAQIAAVIDYIRALSPSTTGGSP